MKKIIIVICLLMGTAIANAQNNFEGVITYDMAFDGANLPPEAMAMLKGSNVNIFIKNTMRRVETNTPMSTTVIIEDDKNKTAVNLMDVMGQKYMIRMGEEELKKQKQDVSVADIKYVDDTKTIAGYKCKKAEIKVNSKGKAETINVYYTDELPYSDFHATFKGLKGVPMEYMMLQRGMKITLTATKVSKETVPDSKFDIPQGYTETTMEELQKNMGRMGGQ